MMRKIGLGLVALMLAAGCSGSDGANGKNGADGQNGTDGTDGTGFDTTASVSGVFPGFALLGASTEVTLSGFATNWDDTTTVSFGDGVTVSSVRVASPTALIATVEVGNTAAMGLRDVTVTTGDEALTYAQGFNLGSPIAVVTQGTVAQGSIVLATIKNMDYSRPFDDTTTGDGFLTPLEYTNLAVTAPTGVIANVTSVSPFSAEVTLLIDGDAASGANALEVLSGPAGSEESFPNPEALNIEARTPTAVTVGGSTDVTIADAFASQYVSVDVPAGLQIVNVASTAGAGDPQIAMLGASQSFQDLLGFGPVFLGVSDASAATTFNGVVWDNTGESGYTASISADLIAATGIAEGASNGDKGSATAFTLPGVVQGASLTDDLDADWFAVTVAAGDVGKSFYVATVAGDPATDTIVTIYDPSDTVFAEGDDAGYHESFVSPAITTAGTYYIAVEASSYGLGSDKAYDLVAYLK
ncbi:MAG: hypothetical protein AB7K71_15240 [Polyangiaceae bacterium]